MSGKVQRVMLLETQRDGASKGTFVLQVLNPGRLALDSGRYYYVSSQRPNTVRDGQGEAVYVALETLVGRMGRLVLRWRTELVGAGCGMSVGTGSWSVLGGTGIYAGATGSGRMAVVTGLPDGATSSQFEGCVRVERGT